MTDTFELLQQGLRDGDPAKLQHAERLYSVLVEATPEDANRWHVLAVIAHVLGNYGVAETRARCAIALNPERAEFQNTLGLVLVAAGQRDAGLNAFRTALAQQRDYIPASENLARHLYEAQRFPEARMFVQESARRTPENTEVMYRYGHTLTQLYELKAGLQVLRQVTLIDPEMAEAWAEIGRVFALQKGLRRAREAFRRALRAAGSNTNLKLAVCHLMFDAGLARSAHEGYQQLLEHEPANLRATFNFALRFPHHVSEAARRPMLLLRDRSGLPLADQAGLGYALARVADARSEWPNAAAHATEGNAAMRQLHASQGVEHNVDHWRRYVSALISTFSPATLKHSRRPAPSATNPLIFIIGLPNSGAQQLERMLGSHGQIFGTGQARIIPLGLSELPLRRGAAGDILQCVRHLRRADLDALALRAERRFAQITQQFEGAVTNYLPDNYLHVGWITQLFPAARIIHCSRDLRDEAIASWMTRMPDAHWSTDLQQIVAYLAQYQRLMTHWQRALEHPMLHLRCDQLAADPESILREALTFCDLPWDETCLESVDQFNKPDGSGEHGNLGPVGFWQNYTGTLGPAEKALQDLDTEIRELS